MRIASLVPSATELLFAMGLGEQVVAVTHECDFPPDAIDLPQLTTSVIPAGLPPAEVDALVRGRTQDGRSLYTLDEELLKEEEPDLIIAQQLCDVCAVSIDDVRAVAKKLESDPIVISLDPTTIGEVLGDIRTIATATDSKDLGVDLVRELADRIDDIKIALKDVGREDGPDPVRVAALEWLDPIFLGGHWIPQMIEIAGGIDFLGLPGEPSREADWEEVKASEPEAVVLMQCGYNASRCADEADDYASQLLDLGAHRYFAGDANAYFSRPGPRLVDGLELLAHALHPTLVPEPPVGALLELDLIA
jgi:iron complex transport system substrate-binding protein